ncbi:MAG: hypothetical protein RR595_12085 [Lysinibacillus sp.]
MNSVVSNRVFHNAKTGEVIFQTGEVFGSVHQRDPEEEVAWLDVEPGRVDYTSEYISAIDIETRDLVISKFPKTDKQRIQELEDELLLQTENEIGGVL